MRIEFETRAEDVVAFNRHHQDESPAVRRMWRNTLIMSAVLPLLAMASIALTERTPWPLLLGVVASPVAALVVWLFLKWHSARVTRQLLAEGSNKGLLGWRVMELEGDRLTVRSEYITSVMDLRVIDRITSTNDFTFVYISSLNALLIPRRDLEEDEYDDFVHALQRAWRQVAP